MSGVSDFLKANRGMFAVVAAALAVGTGAGYWLSIGPGSSAGRPDQPIEWHSVQAVPTRTPDADDQDWQNRVDSIDNAAMPAREAATNDAGPDTAALENANQ
jgi:hypothetical protein